MVFDFESKIEEPEMEVCFTPKNFDLQFLRIFLQ